MPAQVVQSFFPNAKFTLAQEGDDAEVQRLLRRLTGRLSHYRAPGTWMKHYYQWRRAWRWLEPKLAAAMRRRGDRALPTVATLVAYRRFAYALAQRVSDESTLSACCATCTAINFAMAVNQQPLIMNDFPVKMLRDVLRREQGKPPKKMHELRGHELEAVVRRWGLSGVPWKRQIALMMSLGRALLGRFSDLAWLQVQGICFLPEGALVCFARRKNRQYGKYAWLPLADVGGALSPVRLLRAHLAGLGYSVPAASPAGAWVRTAAQVGEGGHFLLRPLVRQGNYTHGHKAQYALGAGRRSIYVRKSTGYEAALKLMRRALRECCGYSKAQVAGFGTQSLRRGGDTALFEAGVSAEKRRLLGMWKTEAVELSYIGFDARQRMRWTQAAARM